MKLDNEKAQQALTFIRSKARGAPPCAWCHASNWLMGERVVEWPDLGHHTEASQRPVRSKGIRHSYAIVLLECAECGLVLPFAAAVVGVAQPILMGPMKLPDQENRPGDQGEDPSTEGRS